MIERPRALEERGAGLADGLKTVAPDTGSLPRGGTPGEAQSERVKRGSRHDDQGVASSTRRSGDSHSTRSAKTTARLRPARSWRHGTGSDAPGVGAGRPMPSLRLSPTSNTDLTEEIQTVTDADFSNDHHHHGAAA